MSGVTADSAWVLDKKVPIALILALLGQTAAGVWWAASISARVEIGETRVNKLETNDVKMTETTARSAEALAAIKATQESMRAALDRIERNIDGRK